MVAATSDSDLLANFAHTASDDALGEIIRRHGGMVYSAALRVLGNAADAEDAAQIAFVTLARKAPYLSRETPLAGWLYRTAVLAAKDIQKMTRRRKHHEVRAADLRNQELFGEEYNDLNFWIEKAVEGLPPRERNVIVLRYISGKSRAETAKILGCPEATVQTQTHRALERMRDNLRRRQIHLSAAGLAAILSAACLPQLQPEVLAQFAAACKAAGLGWGQSFWRMKKALLGMSSSAWAAAAAGCACMAIAVALNFNSSSTLKSPLERSIDLTEKTQLQLPSAEVQSQPEEKMFVERPPIDESNKVAVHSNNLTIEPKADRTSINSAELPAKNSNIATSPGAVLLPTPAPVVATKPVASVVAPVPPSRNSSILRRSKYDEIYNVPGVKEALTEVAVPAAGLSAEQSILRIEQIRQKIVKALSKDARFNVTITTANGQQVTVGPR